MGNKKEIRFYQRCQNLQNAFKCLKKWVEIKSPSDIEIQGVIQSFEFTFELSWKTLKDFFESQWITFNFPKEILKEAFKTWILEDWDIWFDMLESRNILSHTYDEKMAKNWFEKISKKFFPEIEKFISKIKNF